MERWSIGLNGYYGVAHVYKEVGPWWVFVLQSLADGLCIVVDVATFNTWIGSYFCGYVHGPMLNFPQRWLQSEASFFIPMKLAMKQMKQIPKFWADQWDIGTEMWKEYGPPQSDQGEVMRTGSHSIHVD
jgi:hypothetical protein